MIDRPKKKIENGKVRYISALYSFTNRCILLVVFDIDLQGNRVKVNCDSLDKIMEHREGERELRYISCRVV